MNLLQEHSETDQTRRAFTEQNIDLYLIGDLLIHKLETITTVNPNMIYCKNSNKKELTALMSESADFLIDLKQRADESIKLSQKYKQ